MNLEDKLNEYRKRVDQIQEETAEEKDTCLNRVLSYLDHVHETDLNYSRNRFKDPEIPSFQTDLSSPVGLQQVDLTHSNNLNLIDREFIKLFNMNAYFPENFLKYPVVYCETAEEFYTNFLHDEKLSSPAKAQVIEEMVREAEKENGYTLGVDIPSVGCFINGWAFGRIFQLDPKLALAHPVIFKDIAGTAIHEKLGHGFMGLTSELGKTMNLLGFNNIEIAKRFYREDFTSLSDSIPYQQYQILLSSSLILEEGWATWIESYLSNHLFSSKHPAYEYESWSKAIKVNFTNQLSYPFKEEVRKQSNVLFGNDSVTTDALLHAILFFRDNADKIMEGFDRTAAQVFKQPLRYVLGHLLMHQVENNAGPMCVPHAAIIAGNIRFDLTELGIADLARLVSADPRLNADTRLALISKIKLKDEHKNNVAIFANEIENQLSLPVPTMYKPKR
mgnify:CR=1 FL=1